MVISEQMTYMLNQQVAHELGNRNQYLIFSNWAHVLGLKRISAFFKGEADGELGHADKITAYLNEANASLAIPVVDKKVSDIKSCDEIANLYVEAESATTRNLKEIWAQAVTENDIGTQDMLQPLLREQIEEEALAERVSSMIDLSDGDLLKLDLSFEK